MLLQPCLVHLRLNILTLLNSRPDPHRIRPGAQQGRSCHLHLQDPPVMCQSRPLSWNQCSPYPRPYKGLWRHDPVLVNRFSLPLRRDQHLPLRELSHMKLLWPTNCTFSSWSSNGILTLSLQALSSSRFRVDFIRRPRWLQRPLQRQRR